MASSIKESPAAEQFDRTYASAAAIRRLTSIVRGDTPDSSSPDTVVYWENIKHQNMEKARLWVKEDDKRRKASRREKPVTRYDDRYLFAERTRRPRPTHRWDRHNSMRNAYLDTEDFIGTSNLLQKSDNDDDPSKELLPTLRTLVPESDGSSKNRTHTFSPERISPNMSSYDFHNYYHHYEPLPDPSWFRLLIIEPGNFQDNIECQLVTVPRSVASQKYETLSYSWHNRQWYRSGSIMCNGHVMPVTSNLLLALHHIRRRDRPRIIWIDALCINQSNNVERAEQVQSMDSVYAQSFRTLVWLGQASSEDTEAALNRVCELVDTWQESHVATYRIADSTTGDVSTHRFNLDGKPDKSQSWEALRILFDADWFERRWVIQEVVNSRTLEVLWGPSSISWAFIGIAAAILRTQHSQIVDGLMMYNVYNAYLMFRLQPQGNLRPLRLSFLQLLRLTGHFKSSVSHDSFYALLGIQTTDNIPRERPIVQADYSIEYDDLTRQFAETFLQSGRPLSFLSEVSNLRGQPRRANFRRRTQSPSWVPAWTATRLSLLSPWDLDDRFDPSKDFPFTRYTGNEIPKSDLAIDGIIFSTILWVGDLVPDWTANAHNILQIFDSGAFGPPSVNTLSILSYTLRAGRDAYGSRDRSNNSYLAHFAAFLCKSMPMETTSPFLEIARPLALLGNADEFTLTADKVCVERSIFVTSGGHIGLCSNTTWVGDFVAILGGGSMPVVLGRNKPSPSDRLDSYEFIGECFIQDIMAGEVVSAAEKGETHHGRFDPVQLMEKLHDLSALADISQGEYNNLKHEILERTRDTYGKLKVETIYII